MNEINLTTNIKVYGSIDELDSSQSELVSKAIEALNQSYSPYSDFRVGAALLMDNGEIVLGANQENASYPLCMCAERVALYAATSFYPKSKPIKLAITARTENNQNLPPIPPCGACRQVISEFEDRHGKIEILLKGDADEVYLIQSIKQLLPISFEKKFLDE